MELNDARRLLDPRPMPLELGWERLSTGVLHVAARTDMHRCSGAMFDWWFRFRPATREYRWWHPLDHVFSDWAEGTADTHVGSLHIVEEGFTKELPKKLTIQFRDPHEVFDPTELASARASGAVSSVIFGHGGPGHDPRRTPDGTIIGGRMIHLARDTQWGMVLRSHFFLGHDLVGLGSSPEEIAGIFHDEHGPNLLQHCYDEFVWLSHFLPSLYIAENRDEIAVVRPW